MTLAFELATEDDAPALAALHSEVAGELTREFGEGHWSGSASEASVARTIRTSRVLIARDDGGIAGTLRLTTKKPLAIDTRYCSKAKRPVYLCDMAVRPSEQRTGIGRQLVEQAMLIVKEWKADTIRLDAYDAPAGAGDFYAKCGFTEVGRAEHRTMPLLYYELRLTP